jgi:hypothetical protein
MTESAKVVLVHPRVILSESDAQMLFNNGESLIICMAQDLAITLEGVQPSLALSNPEIGGHGE